VARSRRALALLDSGDQAGARDDLARMTLQCPEPVLAAAAVVEWARLERLAADEVARLLDLAPALSECGAGAEAIRAHALALAGASGAALPHYARAAATSRGWSLVVGWGEALAASGRSSAAAGLLRREARRWASEPGGTGLAGAALLAASFIDPDGGPEDPLAAAEFLLAGGAWPDQALAEAATRLAANEREREARRTWQRLIDTVPFSDLASRARENLRRPAAE
jgi:hypothetical protein